MALYMQVLCGVQFIDTSITWKIVRQHSEPEGMGVYSVKIFMRQATEAQYGSGRHGEDPFLAARQKRLTRKATQDNLLTTEQVMYDVIKIVTDGGKSG